MTVASRVAGCNRGGAVVHRAARCEIVRVPAPTETSRGASARIPSLDGFRALSIALVLLYHLGSQVGAPSLLRRFGDVTHAGGLGVRIFFAISGFLITSLLLAEHEARGEISLRRFYFRRTLRILPPYYVYLACVMVAAAAGVVTLRPGDALHAWTFTTNFNALTAAWPVVHSWSLSIEEQFYLLWPGLLVLVGPRRARPLLLAVMVAAAAWRAGAYAQLLTIGEESAYAFRGVADWLAGGALLALSRRALQGRRWYVRLLAHPAFPVVAVAALFGAWTGLGYWRRADLLMTGAVISTVLLLDWAMTHPTHLLARPLNWEPVAWLGRLSYSLYLWQQPFMDEGAGAWWERTPQNLALALGAAMVSYYVVERPALAWRARLEPRLTWLRPVRAEKPLR
jgi:peptidoglycan/LPS O-acetylase OafA/YrhL